MTLARKVRRVTPAQLALKAQLASQVTPARLAPSAHKALRVQRGQRVPLALPARRPAGSADAWSRLGNAGTTAGTNFIGTTDNVAVTVKMFGLTGLRMAPATDGTTAGTTVTPNVIGGDASNTIPATVEASTIGGGVGNSVTNSYATVGGGLSNSVSGLYATVPGGYGAVASQFGQIAWANGYFANPGDAQGSNMLRGASPLATLRTRCYSWMEVRLDFWYATTRRCCSRFMSLLGRRLE